MSAFPYDIFISYSQKDRAPAERLQAAFEAHKLKVWRDERLADAAEASFIGTINDALERSAKVVVLWSRNSVGSAWVQAEAEKARMAGKVVPLALEPIGALLPHLPTPFNILPTIDVSAETPDLTPVLRALGAQQIEGQPEGVLTLVTADVDLSKLPDTYAQKLYGRTREMAALVSAWDNAQTRIFAFDAMGGAGKTALVYHFVQALKASGWRGARSIFAWSFYSQGSNEDRQTSADDFFKAAYKHFGGGKQEPPKDPREKGVELAHLVQKQRALLILDGMEPLQYAAGRTGGGTSSAGIVGGIKDPGVKALLNLLADNNPGLCLLTTRIKLAELRDAHGVVFEPLDRLPLMAGIDLLRDLGVEPGTPSAEYQLPQREEFQSLVPAYSPPAAYAQPPADARPVLPAKIVKELIEAVEELKGHALALTLIGKDLAENHRGDIRAAGDLPALPHIHPADPTRDAYRVMRSIEIGLAHQIEAQRGGAAKPAETAAGRQLALLLFLGFFDRPADTALIPVVFPLAAADYVQPDEADLELAKKDLLAFKGRLEDLAEAREKADRESRRQQIEQEQDAIRAERDEAIEAARRTLVRRIFAGLAENVRDRSKIIEALRELARRGLIAKFDESIPFDKASIDCHPLVREYFGARLKELDGATFCAGHGRLYDHYRYAGLPGALRNPIAYALLADQCAFPDYGAKKTIDDLISGRMNEQTKANTPKPLVEATHEQLRKAAAQIGGGEWDRALEAFLPKDEAGMTPLFAAIAHGCAAEREDETFAEVYWPRIARGNEYFASKKLGLYGQELAALASFFETPFTAPSPRLGVQRATILNLAGNFLRALGRLEDAASPMRAAVVHLEALQEIASAAYCSGNLSELLVAIGRLSDEGGAVAAGQAAVALSDRSRDPFQRMAALSNYADALLQAGALAHAEVLSREAEALQMDRQPSLPRLYSLGGYRYCDLLFARGRAAEAVMRADYVLTTTIRGSQTNLDISLGKLGQARAALTAIPSLAAAPRDCADRSARALAALRSANQEAYIVPGLLAHAEVLWRCGDANAASEPLREAETISRRAPMPLFLAQVHLLAARIQFAANHTSHARSHRNEVVALIEKHGYGRGAVELALLNAEIACAENAEGREAAIAAAMTAIRGEPYRDVRTGITIDGGWWGLLPRLEALLPADHPGLASLHAARDAYNAERDAYLAAEDARAEAGWAEEDRALASPDFRRELSDALVGAGYRLEEMPRDEQRQAARELLQQKRKAEGDDAGLPDIPDELLDQILADPEARAKLEEALKHAGVDQPFDRMPRETQRQAVAMLVAAMQQEQEQSQGKRGGNSGANIPDAMVRQIFADPQAQEMLRDVMQQNNLTGAPAGLPFEVQRAIVAALMEAGVIQTGEAPQAEAPPQPQPDGGGRRGGWWPFGRKH